ncbi:MAG: helicase C-terminal domain-containing protein, partial [archaeon]
YYDQYESYISSDVLIFNAAKYLLESAIGRKPKTDLEIIDECDDFLDSFATEKRLNINRLVMALSGLFPEDREAKNAIKQLLHLANDIIFSSSIFNDEGNDDVEKIKDTKMHDLILKIIENPYLAEGEDNNYYNNVFEIAKSFENLLEETYVSFDRAGRNGNGGGGNGGGNGFEKQSGLFGFSKPREDETVYVNLVSINLAQKFKDLVEQNNVLVLMSGTLHSENVLKGIYGLDNFKIVEAELEMPGTVSKFRTGMEKNCKYENFSNGSVTREAYLKALGACVSNADAPVLVHVSSFSDLPSEQEIADFKLNNIISREKLKEMQFKDSGNRRVDDFKSGNVDVLFTTKCSRGVDFAGDKCRSIILTKYPYPNIQSLFWKILKKEQPNKFMEFYMDKARRELVQKIARGVRFKGDHVLLLSPDSRVLDARVT